MATWRLLDHPADLALEGSGGSPEEAFAGVVDGLLAQLDLGAPGTGTSGSGQEEIAVTGLDWEECVVGALNELLYRVNLRERRLASPQVLEWEETRVRLRLTSDLRPPGQSLETEIKAATYHGLHLSRDPDGSWRLRVVFDL